MKIDGLLVVHTPEGITSMDVVREVKRRFRVKKAGHLGTLDPFATGVLPVVLNDGTKTGAQTYNDAVTLRQDAVLTGFFAAPGLAGGDITFNSAVDSDAAPTPRDLAVNTSGNQVVSGAVGGTFKLGSLSIGADALNRGGTTIFNFAGTTLAPTVSTL